MFILSVMLLSSLLLPAGCTDQRAAQVEAQAALNQALELFRAAHRGYTPDVEASLTLEQYRQQTLDQALPHLETAISQGTQQQQATARALRAQIAAAAARTQARNAHVAFGNISGQMATANNLLLAINKEAVRIEQLKQNQDVVIAQLTELIQRATTEQNQLQAQVSADQTQLDALRNQLAEHREQRAQRYRQSQERRQQAILAEGEARYNLERESVDLERQANRASFEAENTAVEITKVEARLERANTQLATLSQSLSGYNDSLGAAREQNRQMADALQEAQQKHREASEKLIEYITDIYEGPRGYVMLVDEPLTRAAERMTPLAEQLTDRHAQLAVKTDHVFVLMTNAQAARSVAQLIEQILASGSGLSDDTRAALGQQYDLLRHRQRELAQQALTLANEKMIPLAENLLGAAVAGSEEESRLRRLYDDAGAMRVKIQSLVPDTQ